jgi:formate dehydrogenase major subunit
MMKKRLLNTPLEQRTNMTFTLDGATVPAVDGEPLVEAINRALPERHLAQVCYHPQLGPIETCDTCMVDIGGKLVRACATQVRPGMTVVTSSLRAGRAARSLRPHPQESRSLLHGLR